MSEDVNPATVRFVVWQVEGPFKEFDTYWFRHGTDEQNTTAFDFATEWLADTMDRMSLDDEYEVKVRLKEVTQKEWDETVKE